MEDRKNRGEMDDRKNLGGEIATKGCAKLHPPPSGCFWHTPLYVFEVAQNFWINHQSWLGVDISGFILFATHSLYFIEEAEVLSDFSSFNYCFSRLQCGIWSVSLVQTIPWPTGDRSMSGVSTHLVHYWPLFSVMCPKLTLT